MANFIGTGTLSGFDIAPAVMAISDPIAAASATSDRGLARIALTWSYTPTTSHVRAHLHSAR